MQKDIQQYVESCDSCQKREGTHPTESLNPIKVGQSFDRVEIDLVRPLSITTQGNHYIAVAVDYLIKWPKARAIQKADAKLVANFIYENIILYKTLKQVTIKHTLFDLTYGRTAILPINFTVETYPVQPINKENFQETLQRRAYTLLSTLEGKRHIAASHIEYFQALQKEKHDNKLLLITNEFKIGNKVFLHRTKAKKQWSGKFEHK
ncbi:hypothetical protein G9A89_018383 [Geosiphon pyriformis]|nr:hypothetical protein G9A89_018383 [Geosiphon pyriformis]